MAVIAFLFIFVFYIPIYRTARSKGYLHGPIVATTIVYTAVVALSLGLVRSAGIDHWALDLTWLPVSLVLIVLQVLPSRGGAPGEDWFHVKTYCPECGAKIEFDRDRAGLVDSCPQCDEILTLPTELDQEPPGEFDAELVELANQGAGSGTVADRDGDSALPEEEDDEESPKDDDWVLVRGYDSTHLAELVEELLKEAGIPTLLRPMGAGSAILGETTLGWQLLVPEAEREQAEEILPQPDPDSRE